MPYTAISLWRGNLAVTNFASHRDTAASKTSSTSSTPPFEQPEFSPEARPSQSMYMAHYPGQELVPHAGKRFLCCLYREWIPLLVDTLQ